jgi:lysophospholipase L1-like esterase
VVSLLIGVNDQYQTHDTSGYRQRFLNLLNTSIQLAGNHRDHVFVLSIPDYSVTPFAQFSDTAFIRLQIDQFNAINKEVTLQNNCKYLDITPSTRQAKYDASLLATDGLHPSGKEYYKWSELLGPMMKAVLQ